MHTYARGCIEKPLGAKERTNNKLNSHMRRYKDLNPGHIGGRGVMISPLRGKRRLHKSRAENIQNRELSWAERSGAELSRTQKKLIKNRVYRVLLAQPWIYCVTVDSSSVSLRFYFGYFNHPKMSNKLCVSLNNLRQHSSINITSRPSIAIKVNMCIVLPFLSCPVQHFIQYEKENAIWHQICASPSKSRVFNTRLHYSPK